MFSLSTIILILVLLEIFEAWWQYSSNMELVLLKAYQYYRKSIFLFFLMHPSFYFTLFVILSTEILNGWILAILVFKTLDLFFKINIMKGLFEDGNLNNEIRAVLKEPISPIIFLTGLGLYPFLMFYGLS